MKHEQIHRKLKIIIVSGAFRCNGGTLRVGITYAYLKMSERCF